MEKMRTEYMVCLYSPDIIQYKNTAWGAINAMSDMATHNPPRRTSKSYWENNWGRVMDGHVMIDKMASMLVKA